LKFIRNVHYILTLAYHFSAPKRSQMPVDCPRNLSEIHYIFMYALPPCRERKAVGGFTYNTTLRQPMVMKHISIFNSPLEATDITLFSEILLQQSRVAAAVLSKVSGTRCRGVKNMTKRTLPSFYLPKNFHLILFQNILSLIKNRWNRTTTETIRSPHETTLFAVYQKTFLLLIPRSLLPPPHPFVSHYSTPKA